MLHSIPDKSLSFIMAILPQHILCSSVVFNSKPSEYSFYHNRNTLIKLSLL